MSKKTESESQISFIVKLPQDAGQRYDAEKHEQVHEEQRPATA